MSLQHRVPTVSIAKNTTMEGVPEGACPWGPLSSEQQELTLLLFLGLPGFVLEVVSFLTFTGGFNMCKSREKVPKRTISL
jgi:hypothetical protein